MKRVIAATLASLFALVMPASATDAVAKIDAVLEMQPAEMKARYKYRNPKKTLRFFDVRPGMKVADLMAGKDWYAGILLPYLGSKGFYAGIDLNAESWEAYAPNARDPEAFLKNRLAWTSSFKKELEEIRKAGDAAIDTYVVGSVPEQYVGQLDRVLAFRALHLSARYKGHLTRIAEGVFKALKPGGIFGVVQHRAAEGLDDEWADGSNGYLKEARLIKAMEAAGFVLDAKSEINANPLDKPDPAAGDFVWRLPPTYEGAPEGSERRIDMDVIGETDRMTLKFRKPA